MALHLIESTHQEQLAEELVRKLAEPSDAGVGDFLDVSTVIVQNSGLGRWLRLACARLWHFRGGGHAVCASLSSAAGKHLDTLGLYEHWHELSTARMRWRIFECLQEGVFEQWEDAGPLRSYLSDPDGGAEVRAWALAGRIAELYDRYAVHRPEWIESWANGAWLNAPLLHWNWQARLFRSVLESLHLGAQDLRRRCLGLALQDYLSVQESSGTQATKPIHVFGMSTFPPVYLAFFQKLAVTREVYIYHLIPSRAYLEDLPRNYRAHVLANLDAGALGSDLSEFAQNGLLVANGQAAARFQSLLLALNIPTGKCPSARGEAGGTDLANLQDAIRSNWAHVTFRPMAA